MGFLYSQLFVTPAVPRSDLTGQTIIVTGANVGLGLEAARHFAHLNASKVILACRDVAKGNAAANSIVDSTRVPKSRIEVWQLDLSSYKSVKAFADRVAALPRLDAVVENAGIVTKHFKMMEDNESTITVNLVSTILLGLLLLPKLRESARANKKDGRLVFVGSEVYMWAKFTEQNARGNIFDALNSRQTSNMSDRYVHYSRLTFCLGFHLRQRVLWIPSADKAKQIQRFQVATAHGGSRAGKSDSRVVRVPRHHQHPHPRLLQEHHLQRRRLRRGAHGHHGQSHRTDD